MKESASEKLAEIEAEILQIIEECKSQGLSREEMKDIFAPLGLPQIVNKLSKDNKSPSPPDPITAGGRIRQRVMKVAKSKALKRAVVFLAIFAVMGFVIGRNEEQVKTIRFHALAIARILLIKLLPYWNWTEYYYTRCLVRNPFFETPNLNVDDCNLCESLEEVKRIFNASQNHIIEAFIRREKPFIVTDAMDDWMVMNTDQFWFDNVTEIYLQQETYQVCNVNTNLRIPNGDFTKLLRRLYNPRNQEWFIHWENCQKEMSKSVRQFYRRPYFISNSLDFTGSNWVLMSSDFKGRVYKKLDVTDSLTLVYQLRGFNYYRISPKETCRGLCPEFTGAIQEGEILVLTNLLWLLEYIPGEGDNLAIVSEASWPSME